MVTHEEITRSLDYWSSRIGKYGYSEKEVVELNDKFLTRLKLSRRVSDLMNILSSFPEGDCMVDVDLESPLSLEPLKFTIYEL